MSNDPGGLIQFIHAVLGLLTSTSVQGAVCLSVGGALTYVGILLGCPSRLLPLLLLAGMAVPLWPLWVYYSPERINARTIATTPARIASGRHRSSSGIAGLKKNPPIILLNRQSPRPHFRGPERPLVHDLLDDISAGGMLGKKLPMPSKVVDAASRPPGSLRL